MPLPYYNAKTDVGLVRNNNEDALLVSPSLKLWAVADGMGGHASGEVASAVANITIEESIEAGASLSEAIQRAHKAVLNEATEQPQYRGMGSTIVAVQSSGTQYQVAWVGDSRAYLWTHSQLGRQLEQLTTDHSYVQMLYQAGAITAKELNTHPERNVITQCLGSLELSSVNVETVDREWRKGDWLLLCSDGLTDAVGDQAICDILSAHTEIPSAVDALVQAALDNGGRDNVSVLIVSRPPTGFNRILRALGV
ncbi:PP2C family protein-serine/threonine phosphatase [Marinagarivorans cellulosilyticus]|uniref:PPM family protein phosphatase n=1 Tax=Marinagarivorans cellulosilyticus TaxID=2721545 RepID=A0AAN1WJB7_9GAMM|nr:PP2C family serine/threonine-protein phosphatase [Marinagarivorans cellulosilyticus]BCD98615.1 PPM family protein phosphatase [Marinagarivorans cellulosilyticus]